MQLQYRMALAVFILASLSLSGCGKGKGSQIEIVFYGNPDQSGATTQNVERCNREALGSYVIRYQPLGPTVDARHEQVSRPLAARRNLVDVIAVDNTWTEEFARAGWVRSWGADDAMAVTKDVFPSAIAAAAHNGVLVGAPLEATTELLWYRKSLIAKAPVTWDEVIALSERLNGQQKPHFIEVPGDRTDDLTRWFQAMTASADGFLDQQNETDQFIRAAELMLRLASSASASPYLDTENAADNSAAFEQGDAAMQINQHGVYKSARNNSPSIAEDMGWSAYPRLQPDKPAHTVVSGQSLAVSTFSRHPARSFAAARCLSNAMSQQVLATVANVSPSNASLYSVAAVRAALPYADTLREALEAASRPAPVRNYTGFSLALANALSPLSSIDVSKVNSQVRAAVHEGK